MVLYKRKQVTFLKPPPVPHDLNQEVFYIPETKEWFINYEDYLNRLDYYRRRKFVCEITGNSCLTFYEASQSEIKEIKGVEKNFPEALREHILRFLQFNRITRLDQLVDKVYSVFKNDYFPGETIFIRGPNFTNSSPPSSYEPSSPPPIDSSEDLPTSSTSLRLKGVIREKVQYSNPSDGLTTRYLVARLQDGQQAIVTKDNISRDRNHFTKWLIKTFIKLTMSRSHKVGAPWVVKDKFAKKYRIPQEYPDDLKHFESSTPNGEIIYDDNSKPKKTTIPTSKLIDTNDSKDKSKKSNKQPPNSKNLKKKAALNNLIDNENQRFKPIAPSVKSQSPNQSISPLPPIQTKREDPRKKFPLHHLPEAVQNELHHAELMAEHSNLSSLSVTISSFQPTKKNIVDDLELEFDLQNSKPLPSKIKLPENAKIWNNHLIEDFKEKLNSSQENQDSEESKDEINSKIEFINSEIIRLSNPNLPALQEALESWTFLNIYHSVLKLDTFTFDDFIYAMGWNHDQFDEIGRCELLDEIWCSVLGAIVSNKLPTGKDKLDDDEIFGLLIDLPPEDSFINPPISDKSEDPNQDNDSNNNDRGSESENEDKTLKSDDDVDSGNESNSDNESKPKSKKKNISNKNQKNNESDNDADDNEEEDDEEEDQDVEMVNSDSDDDKDRDDEREHNAYIVMNHRGTPWHERLRRRNFKDGNWQCIALGVLSLVEYVPHYKPIIDKIYKNLAPKDESPTPTNVLNNFYSSLDIEYKLKFLNILTSLLASGDHVRDYIDDCLDMSTSLRRNRLDNIRDYKTNLDSAQKYHQQIHEMLSKDILANGLPNISNDESYTPYDPKKKPRLNFNAFEMIHEEKSLADRDSSFKELWENRKNCLIQIQELKKSKREIELKLTEIDCQRVKLLGKDRLFNRYWWFENNGLPNLHASSNGEENEDEESDKPKKNLDEDDDDDSDEVLEETYLMGRLWIQGPSEKDLQINLNTSHEEASRFDEEIQRLRQEHDQEEVEIEEQTTIAENYNDEGELIIDESKFVDLKDGKPPLKKMNFSKFSNSYKEAAKKLYYLEYKDDSIVDSSKPDIKEEPRIKFEGQFIQDNSPNTIIGNLGLLNHTLPVTALPIMQRKLIEEQDDPTFNGKYWRYYDRPEQLNKLVQWLNPWGKRESQLRKELAAVKDAIVFSMEARRKALWIDRTPEAEVKLEEQLSQLSTRLEHLENQGEEEEELEEYSEDDNVTRKRNLRSKPGQRKRQKTISIEETLTGGSIEELKELQGKLQEELKEKKEERELSRVLEWVNSSAIDQFDKSLYEGGDRKLKGKPKKNKK